MLCTFYKLSIFLDPYVKIYLLHKEQRISKKKTHVKKRTLNPVFNESFVFDLPRTDNGMTDIQLEFALLDWDRVTKNEVREDQWSQGSPHISISRSSEDLILGDQSVRGQLFTTGRKYRLRQGVRLQNGTNWRNEMFVRGGYLVDILYYLIGTEQYWHQSTFFVALNPPLFHNWFLC